MKVIRPDSSKIGCQLHGNIEGISEIILGVIILSLHNARVDKTNKKHQVIKDFHTAFGFIRLFKCTKFRPMSSYHLNLLLESLLFLYAKFCRFQH